jgi:hypothetical protein
MGENEESPTEATYFSARRITTSKWTQKRRPYPKKKGISGLYNTSVLYQVPKQQKFSRCKIEPHCGKSACLHGSNPRCARGEEGLTRDDCLCRFVCDRDSALPLLHGAVRSAAAMDGLSLSGAIVARCARGH